MPSPRSRRETAPAAVSWSAETRPADAMPDYGDYGLPGYIPGVTGRRSQPGHPVTRPRERRNGLPRPVFYITDQVREYYAAQGRVLPAARAYYGTGRDTLTGHLSDSQLQEEASS
jgi:hypothetical protein